MYEHQPQRKTPPPIQPKKHQDQQKLKKPSASWRLPGDCLGSTLVYLGFVDGHMLMLYKSASGQCTNINLSAKPRHPSNQKNIKTSKN
mmetsp:Transcript_134906/g.234517  ORF Transcript_134906/g.234517 Transcript_134906/m.234517 type:complete len:88 (-) Transcript_134906:41-304(-)